MYETEKWKDYSQNDLLIEKNLWKSTNYIQGNIQLNDVVNLNLVTYFQSGYDNDSDLFRSRIVSDINLNAGITGRLSFINNFSMQYDYQPIIPIKQFNYSLTNG